MIEENKKIEDSEMPKNNTGDEKDFLIEQITQDVRELEQYVKEFSEFLPLPVILVTPVKNIVDINYAFMKLFGYEEVELIGQKVDFIFKNKRDLNTLFEYISKYNEVQHLEMKIIAKEGHAITVSVSASKRKDDNNNVVGYFIAFSDITDFKKLQDSLEDKVRERTKELEKMQKILLETLDEIREAKDKIEKEKNKTSGIISNFPDPIIVLDQDWRIMMLNPAAQQVFGFNDSDLGKKINVKDDKFSFSVFQDATKTKFTVKEMILDKTGNVKVEEVSIHLNTKVKENENPFSAAYAGLEKGSVVYRVITSAVYDENKTCYGHMKIFFDLTREKSIDKMKSEFISIAAHQLRTPLSAIKWAIRLVLDEEMGKLNDMQIKTLQKGYQSNERIIKLVNDMLDVSHIEEGRFGYSFEKGSIEDVLKSVLDNIENKVKTKQIDLVIEKPNKIPLIDLDKEKLSLLIQNLLENAVTYSPENGKIEINIKVKKEDIELKVKDNGVGIPKSDQDKLFTKFFRASNVVRMQTDGSGLGLFIAKNVVEMHGGSITCKSEEGKGTEFTINLPIKNKNKK